MATTRLDFNVLKKKKKKFKRWKGLIDSKSFRFNDEGSLFE